MTGSVAGRWPGGIRCAGPSDAAALLTVHRRSILELGPLAYSAAECASWVEGLSVARYSEAMAAGFSLLVEERDGAVLGFAALSAAELTGLYVDPDHTRKGIASRLLRDAETLFRARGHRRMEVRAALSAEAFYRRHGYGEPRPEQWPTRGGLAIAIVRLRKRLA